MSLHYSVLSSCGGPVFSYVPRFVFTTKILNTIYFVCALVLSFPSYIAKYTDDLKHWSYVSFATVS